MLGLTVVAAAFAGGFGALVRFALSQLGTQGRFPWPVLVCNLAGSFLAGLAIALLHGDPLVAIVVVTGFCGGLTTFSTFTVETVQLATAKQLRAAVLNLTVTVVVGVALAALGLVAGSAIA